MKRSSFLAAFCFLATQASFAYEYEITCHNKQLVNFENSGVDQNSDECKAFIANGFLKCFDSKKTNQSSEVMTISTPNDHYYQSKESNRYSRKTIQAIVDSAVKGGNDPYLTLSIVITENPPTVSGKKGGFFDNTQMYADSYGTIPLDAIAVADTMNCDRVQTGFGNGLMQLQNGGKLKQFVIDPAGVEKTVCMNNQFTAGEGAYFYVEKNPKPTDCCMKVKADSAGFVTRSTRRNEEADVLLDTDLKNKVMDTLAQKYMSNRFAAAQSRVADQRTPQSKMAMVAQAYNGYGSFGASEAMNNRCLHKIKMGKSPVYGAGTSEIMLNSLMNNSEVEKMVADSLKKHKKAHPVSHLCNSYGSGTHKVDGYVFTNLLEDYLGERKTCSNYTNKLKKLSKFTKSSAPKNPFSGDSETSESDREKSTPSGTAN